MSNDAYDKYQEEIATDREEAAAAWDAGLVPDGSSEDAALVELVGKDKKDPPPKNPHGYKHGEYVFGDVLGNDSERDNPPEMSRVRKSNDDVLGALEFQGKEDYIRGETACLRGVDIVGTVPQRGSTMGSRMTRQQQPMGYTVKKTPNGKPIIAHVVNKTKPLDHKTSINNARVTAQRAASISKKLQDALKKGGAKIVGADVSELLGDEIELLGEVVGAARPRAYMSAAQIKKVAVDLAAAAKKLSAGANVHEKIIANAVAKQSTGVAKAKAAYNPSGTLGRQIQVLGAYDLLGSDFGDGAEWVEILGEELLGRDTLELLGTSAPDPSNPGYYLDGTPDVIDQMVPDGTGNNIPNPNYGTSASGQTGSAAPGTTAASSPTASDGTPGPPDYGVGSAPALAGSTITMSDGTTWPVEGHDYMPGPDPSTDTLVYDALPPGAIVYDPTIMGPLPWQGVGSFTRFYPSADTADGKANSGFQLGGGDPSKMDGFYWWWHGATAGTEYKHESAGNSLSDGYQGASTLAKREDESVKMGWGPIIGKPGGWTNGLRLDRSSNQLFWFWDQAPPAAQQAGPKGVQAAYAKALLDYSTQLTAAKANYAAAIATDQLNAKQAAAVQVQQRAEDAAAQHASDLAATNAAAQQPQLQNQETQLEQQMAKQALVQQQQQDQLDFQRGQAENTAYQQFLSQPPPMSPMDGGAGGGDAGGDGGAPGPFDDLSNQIPDASQGAPMDDSMLDDGALSSDDVMGDVETRQDAGLDKDACELYAADRRGEGF